LSGIYINELAFIDILARSIIKKEMKNIFALLGLMLAFGTTGYSQDASDYIGKWLTIDDDGVTKKSVIEFEEVDGKIHGTIIKLFREPDEIQDPKCISCKGDLKDQKIIGMQILNGLEPKGEYFGDGTIVDPESGKVYNCWVQVDEEDSDILNCRGYVGFSLLGRTQTWRRVTE